MKKSFLLIAPLFALLVACGGSGSSDSQQEAASQEVPATAEYDPNRGIGPYDDYVFPETPDPELIANGDKIAGSKCRSCHKMTDERLVGPGWKGVTDRHTGAWLMNFITNPDPMIDKDPVLQSQLEICLVRMPNQNVSEDEAKAIVAFMRSNDLTK